jgi:hypothetical protein
MDQALTDVIDELRARVSQLEHYVGTTANRLGVDNPAEIRGTAEVRSDVALERVGEATLAAIEAQRDAVALLTVEREQFRLLHRNAQRAVDALRVKLQARAGVFPPDMVAKVDQDLAGTSQLLDDMIGLYVAGLGLGTDLQAMVELDDILAGFGDSTAVRGMLVAAIRRAAHQQVGGA